MTKGKTTRCRTLTCIWHFGCKLAPLSRSGPSHLGLRQTQRQSAKLEHLSELLDLVQIYPVDYVVRGLVDRRLICNQ